MLKIVLWVGLNGVEKSEVMPYIPENQYPVLSIHEYRETQLYASSVGEPSHQKRWVSLGL